MTVASDDDEQVEDGGSNPEADTPRTVDRRALLKAAVGGGIAVAALSVPKVSVVPAYALTTSQTTDNIAYGFGWSSNNPDGKGWMRLNDQPDGNFIVGPNAKHTNTCGVLGPTGNWVNSANSHSGTASCTDLCVVSAPAKGPVRYTWTIARIGSLGTGTFDLSIVLSGSVNGGGGASLTVGGLPNGYCLSFFNNGTGSTTNIGNNTTPGYSTGLIGGGKAKVTMTTRTTGTISPLNPSVLSLCGDTAFKAGKIYWHFDVVPCP